MYTMEDFKKGKMAVNLKTQAEQDAFFTMCLSAGIERVTDCKPFYRYREFGCVRVCGNTLNFSDIEYYKRIGQTIISFPDIKKAPAEPSRELHITSDGMTTHAVLKEGGKVVKHKSIKLYYKDNYDFLKASRILVAMIEGNDPFLQKPAVKEVKRAAKKGEWIKIVDKCKWDESYKNGDIGRVEHVCTFDGIGVKAVFNNVSYPILTKEYVVLEGYTG